VTEWRWVHGARHGGVVGEGVAVGGHVVGEARGAPGRGGVATTEKPT